MKENKFKNTETMKVLAEIITAQKELCELYSLTNANMNSNVEQSNRVTLFVEDIALSREVIDTMNLQNDFFNATSRVTVWVDSNVIVVFVGAVFAVHCKLAESDNKEKFEQLFKESRDEKYNERTLKKKVITALTETRHTFESIDSFKEFFETFSQLVTARKKALAETEKELKEQAVKAESKNSKKAESKKAESKKEKAESKNSKNKNSKKEKADFSNVSAEKLAEYTKEVIESEMKAQ